jgi:hypothetical protein
VRVYDPASLTRVATIAIEARMPRALAVNGNGTRVYAAGLFAGNRTTVLPESVVGNALPPPNPPMVFGLPPAPGVGLIVKQLANGDWVDETGRAWNAHVPYSVLDADVSEINTATNTVSRTFGDIGTVNFALAVEPVGGTVAATATEARNFTRFAPNVRGHLVDTRAAFITPGGSVTVANLNPYVDYTVTPGPAGPRNSAIGIPTGIAWYRGGSRVLVTSLASHRIVALDPALPGRSVARAATVAGPTGVVADDARGRVYVVGRFHNQLQTLDAGDLHQLGLTGIGFDPTPDAIVNGRKFFYGGFTSGHGDQACATCHVFGDFDDLAWDLGNPEGTLQPVDLTGQGNPLLQSAVHPMKGPMVTQSLRGLPNTGQLHWRADRANLDAFDEAFVSLLGRASPLPDSEMAALDDFVLALVHPPNPNLYLDRTLPGDPVPSDVPSAKRGLQFFMNVAVDQFIPCAGCHRVTGGAPGTNEQIIDRFVLQAAQDLKVPQLRNLYRKTGFVRRPGARSKRGFGFTHNGSVDDLFDFLQFPGFRFPPNPDPIRRDLEQFLLDFDTGMAPAVGAQVTFTGANDDDPATVARLDTLISQAQAGGCEVIAKGRVNGEPRGWLYAGAGRWRPDRRAESDTTTALLRALGGPGSEITMTGVPFGSGARMAIDRDRDGWRDGDELAAGSDPGDPASTPASATPVLPPEGLTLRSIRPNPFRDAVEVAFNLGLASRVDLAVYDIMGREVTVVARGASLGAGPQSLGWDGRDARGRSMGAGVYFLRLRTGIGGVTRAVVRVR